MARKFIVAFAILALAVVFAGTVPGVASYRITLRHPSVMNGTALKAGEYRLTLGDSKVTLVQNKESFVVDAKIETGTGDKFDNTTVRYRTEGEKTVIDEIRIGGTKTRILVP